MSKYIVEVLTDRDKDWFVTVAAVDMLTEELMRPELVNIPHLYLMTNKVIKDETAFVVKYGDICVGALAAMLVPNIYNPEIKTFVELFWYVTPEYRKTRAGSLLFLAFENKGEECSDESTMSLLRSSEVNTDTLEKRGFLLEEYAFRKEHRKT